MSESDISSLRWKSAELAYWVRYVVLIGLALFLGLFSNTPEIRNSGWAPIFMLVSTLCFLGSIFIVAREHAKLVALCFVVVIAGVTVVIAAAILVVPAIIPYLIELAKEVLKHFFPIG